MYISCTCHRRPHDVPKNFRVQRSNVERHIDVQVGSRQDVQFSDLGRHVDVQNWSWTDWPDTDMICTSFRPPLFNGKVQKAHECLCCLCHHGTVYHDFENEHQMVVRRPDASQGKHLVQRPDIFINAIVHTLLYLDMIVSCGSPPDLTYQMGICSASQKWYSSFKIVVLSRFKNGRPERVNKVLL